MVTEAFFRVACPYQVRLLRRLVQLDASTARQLWDEISTMLSEVNSVAVEIGEGIRKSGATPDTVEKAESKLADIVWYSKMTDVANRKSITNIDYAADMQQLRLKLERALGC